MALQLRRGSNLQRLSITPQPGELIFTTDQKALWIGDGLTAGGINVLASAFPQGNPSGLEWNSSTNTVNFNINSFSALTTTNVPEGTNKYFTPTAMLTALNTAIAAGTQNGITFTIANGALSATVTGGGTTLPDKTGNSGKWLTLDNSGNLIWHTAPLGSGLSLPSMPGNQGSYLTTDGTNLTWKDIAINSLSSGSYHLTLDESTGNLFLNQAYPGGAGSIMLPQGGDILKYNGTTYVSALNGFINSVQADTNPKLGANLDLNGHNIVGTTGTINITQSVTAGTIVATTGLGANLPLNSYGITGSGNINIIGTVKATTGLGGDLSLNSYNITGTGAVNITGTVTSTSVATNTLTGGASSIVINSTAQSPLSLHSIGAGSLNTGLVPVLALNSSKGSPSVPLDTIPGDYLHGINFTGYHSGNYISSGSIVSAWAGTADLTASDPASTLNFVTGGNNSYNVMTFDNTCTLSGMNSNSGNGLTVAFGDGTQANPSITFATDSGVDSGFFHPGDGIVCVTINAHEQARFDNGGLRVQGFNKVGSFAGSGIYPRPAEAGMIIFDSNTNHFMGYNGSVWKQLDN
jgi:hypothetical protein